MQRKRLVRFVILVATGLCAASPAWAQAGPVPGATPPGPALDRSTKRTYLQVAGGAYLYEPVSPGKKSRIAILVMHSDENYMANPACFELSRRGYRVLCANRNGPSGGSLDQGILSAGDAVAYLRSVPGVQKIVLLGHSGGATLMTSYQMIAENGLAACQGPGKLHACPDSLAGMPPADGIMLLDSNWGNAEMSLLSIDPAVLEQGNGLKLDPALDLFNPENGFNPNGSSAYSPAFIRNFQAGVARREQALTRYALERMEAVRAGRGTFADDEPFIAAGINQTSNKLFPQDTALMSHTVKPWPLLHADGSTTTEIIRSVRQPTNLRPTTASLQRGGEVTTLSLFLTNHAIRVADSFGYGEDSVHGVDWTSTYSSPPGNIQSIAAPLLLLGMTGSYEYLAAETLYSNAKSTDKSLAFVEGATHVFTPCKPCEKTPGQFGNTQTTLFNYVDTWLSKPGRF